MTLAQIPFHTEIKKGKFYFRTLFICAPHTLLCTILQNLCKNNKKVRGNKVSLKIISLRAFLYEGETP
jgi:hypothetical protein